MKEKISADWLALAADVCADAGIPWRIIEPIRTMEQQFEENDQFHNNTVLLIDDSLILKLFGPTQLNAFHVEQAVLQTLADHARFSAPRLVAAAARPNTFPYIIMTVIDGEAPDRQWTGYTASEQRLLAAELGAITRELHDLPLDNLAAVEAKQGGAKAEIAAQEAERIADINATTHFTPSQRKQFLRFVMEEAHQLFDEPAVLTHSDLSHAHLFVARDKGTPHITGFIDWGEALIGPAAWDIAAHWSWSFSCNRPMMRAFLASYYPNGLPDRLARRCLATFFYTYSMELLWPFFFDQPFEPADPIREATLRLFPSDIFGPPD